MDISGGGTPIGNLVQAPEPEYQEDPAQQQPPAQQHQQRQQRQQRQQARSQPKVRAAEECPASPGIMDVLRCSSLGNVSYMTILMIFLVCGISISSMRYTRGSMPQAFLSGGDRGMIIVHAVFAALGFVVANGVINPPA